mmetsp:Transcript_10071/g.23299  ORF Transcript_10071/g.23299 Transcript_10071/m.23299 type:complete len:306 (+) Transcript_10071:63-980(+)
MGPIRHKEPGTRVHWAAVGGSGAVLVRLLHLHLAPVDPRAVNRNKRRVGLMRRREADETKAFAPASLLVHRHLCARDGAVSRKLAAQVLVVERVVLAAPHLAYDKEVGAGRAFGLELTRRRGAASASGGGWVVVWRASIRRVARLRVPVVGLPILRVELLRPRRVVGARARRARWRRLRLLRLLRLWLWLLLRLRLLLRRRLRLRVRPWRRPASSVMHRVRRAMHGRARHHHVVLMLELCELVSKPVILLLQPGHLALERLLLLGVRNGRTTCRRRILGPSGAIGRVRLRPDPRVRRAVGHAGTH